MKSYDECLKINPYSELAYNNKGDSLIELNRLQEAADCFENALKVMKNENMREYYLEN